MTRRVPGPTPVLGLRLSERIYRLLLRVYPPAYRRACGSDLTDFFRDRYREEFVARGWMGVVGLWVRSLADVLASGLAERWKSLRRSRRAGFDKTKENWVETLLQDVRYALRSFRKRPGFTAVIVVTLALGIGASTAIFTVVNSVLLRPLPYGDADQLTLVWGRMTSTGVERAPWSGLDLLDFRERSNSFEEFAAAFGMNSTLTGDFEPEPVTTGMATSNFFDVLQVVPHVGQKLRGGRRAKPRSPRVFRSECHAASRRRNTQP